MQYRSLTMHRLQPDALTLAAGTWLASGFVLLGLTPLPLHNASLGWTATFWLVLAPMITLGVRAWFTRTQRIAAAIPARSRQGRSARPRERTSSATTVRRSRNPLHRRAA